MPLARGEDPGEPQASGRIVRSRNDGVDSVVYIARPGEDVPVELARTTLRHRFSFNSRSPAACRVAGFFAKLRRM